jgi:hypothetical protein
MRKVHTLPNLWFDFRARLLIEIARKFPTADILERLAAALDINTHELFSVAISPERAMEQLQHSSFSS